MKNSKLLSWTKRRVLRPLPNSWISLTPLQLFVKKTSRRIKSQCAFTFFDSLNNPRCPSNSSVECRWNAMLRVLVHSNVDERFRLLAFHLKGRTISDVIAAIRTKRGASESEQKQAAERRNILRSSLGVFISSSCLNPPPII